MQRKTRTRGALAEAVLDLATHQPLADITMTALAQRADITRETAYRHAQDVAHALASAIGDELDGLESAAGNRSSGGRAPVLLVDHVMQRAAIYRHAMNPRLDACLRNVLLGSISRGLTHRLDTQPELAPSSGSPANADFSRAAFVAYAAAGAIGVLEEWLASDDPVDRDTLIEVLFSAAPEWWQR